MSNSIWQLSLIGAICLIGTLTFGGERSLAQESEGVSWNLLSEPIELSPEQIATFESIYSYNARPIQPLEGRAAEFHPAK